MIISNYTSGGKPMPINDIITLDAIYKEIWEERASEISESKFFELFTAEQALKDFVPTDDEVASGQVGGGNDGGLDSIYFLINRRFVSDEMEFDRKAVTRADLILIQSSMEDGFNEKRMEKLNLLTEDLLNLSYGKDKFSGEYNEDLLSIMEMFKKKYREFCTGIQEFTISYYYICKGDTGVINKSLEGHKDRIISKAKSHFSQAKVSFIFIGAAELLKIISKHPLKKFPLLVESSTSRKTSWVCLVPIVEYYKFITTEEGDLRNELFEANVRDWLDMIPVNKAIQDTLEDKTPLEDFWWLNNGVTIIASKAPNEGGTLSVENPLVVNGLQTSHCIYDYVRSLKDKTKESRDVLVRIIVTEEPEISDHIIRATNSQTVVPEFSLHMTEKIHRQIEGVLRAYNLYYDRRRNYYKNEGVRISQILRPMILAQTVISVLLQRPDDAKGRPTTVLKKEYERVFNPKYSLNLFVNCALLIKKVDQFLSKQIPIRYHRSNLRWYVAMVYAQALTNKNNPRHIDLSEIEIPGDEEALISSLEKVKKEYELLGESDIVAKGTELVAKLGIIRKTSKT